MQRKRIRLQQAIAILDSGVGGLTVVREVMRQLPREKIIYFGDTARAPYGSRPQQEVLSFTREIVGYLEQFEPKMIVIACNTATAVALDDIRSRVSVPVVGVIHPGARAAIKHTRSGIIGVIGTEGTIRSGAYEHALQELLPNVVVYSLACPQFVPLVERGTFATPEVHTVVGQALEPLQDKPIDCLILGCTHYPFLSPLIGEKMGSGVKLISSADETAREMSTLLYHRRLLARTDRVPVHHFMCSGDLRLFQRISRQWLGLHLRARPAVWQKHTW